MIICIIYWLVMFINCNSCGRERVLQKMLLKYPVCVLVAVGTSDNMCRNLEAMCKLWYYLIHLNPLNWCLGFTDVFLMTSCIVVYREDSNKFGVKQIPTIDKGCLNKRNTYTFFADNFYFILFKEYIIICLFTVQYYLHFSYEV